MSEHDEPSPENDPNTPEPIQGQVRFSQLSARVPAHVGSGVFANGVLILMGLHECVLDFIQRLGEPHRIVARVVMPHVVARQLTKALHENLKIYESRYGRIAAIAPPRAGETAPPPPASTEQRPAQPAPPPDPSITETIVMGSSSAGTPTFANHPENQPVVATPPGVQDIYDEFRLPDEMLSGSYTNFVMIRHSPTEFCFDFITNIFPRSAVSARVYLATPHVPGFWMSLQQGVSELSFEFVARTMWELGFLPTIRHGVWHHIPGSVGRYLDALSAPLHDRIRFECTVERVERNRQSVTVASGNSSEDFDHVVFAIPPRQALALIVDPTTTEQEVLDAFSSQSHTVVFTSDVELARSWTESESTLFAASSIGNRSQESGHEFRNVSNRLC